MRAIRYLLDCLHLSTAQVSCLGFPPVDGQEIPPSDLRDVVWARLAPLIPPALPGGRRRNTDMRAAMNAILDLLRTGCPWRYLPRHSFPPRSTVHDIFRRFQRDGVASRLSPRFVQVKTEIRVSPVALVPSHQESHVLARELSKFCSLPLTLSG